MIGFWRPRLKFRCEHAKIFDEAINEDYPIACEYTLTWLQRARVRNILTQNFAIEILFQQNGKLSSRFKAEL